MVRLIIILLLAAVSAHAQKYSTALGLRFGNNHYGVTAKQKILRKTTLEGIFAIDADEFQSTLLAGQHFPLLGKGFNIYAGGGMHLGEQKETGTFYGYDLVVGAEIKFPALPIVISADIKPAYHINHPDWFAFSTAVSARYIIAKDSRASRKKSRERRKRRRDRKRGKDEETENVFRFDFLKKKDDSKKDN